jgi:hypothetical protein
MSCLILGAVWLLFVVSCFTYMGLGLRNDKTS